MHNNLRLKYLMRYEKRVQERNEHRKMVKKLEEAKRQMASPQKMLQNKNYGKFIKGKNQVNLNVRNHTIFETFIKSEMVECYSSIMRGTPEVQEEGSQDEHDQPQRSQSTLFSKINIEEEIQSGKQQPVHRAFKETLLNIFNQNDLSDIRMTMVPGAF